MSTPAAKRRRIDAATHTLSKPFRSPFKTLLKAPSTDGSAITAQHDNTESVKTSEITSADRTETPSFSARSTLTPIRAKVPKKIFSSPISTATLNSDPDIAPLLKTQREFEKQLRDLKEELETTEQARKIEFDSKKKNPDGEVDGELVELINKWKSASRQASEEMFGTVRDRVNRMGGPRAWKEMQKRQQGFQSGWDEVPTNNDSDDNDDEAWDGEKRDLYAEYDIDPETENEKEQRGGGDTGEDPGQEDEFTMAMMLRTLNVDLGVIGYDREQQRWAD